MTIQEIESLRDEILQINCEGNYGNITRVLPNKLEELKQAMLDYCIEKGIDSDGIDIENGMNDQINECKNCPPSFGKTLEEDKKYKEQTVAQAKNAAKHYIMIINVTEISSG